jgi:hypothetical protein
MSSTKRWVRTQKTFHKDGFKVIFCRNCFSLLCKTYLGDKITKIYVCKVCNNTQLVAPPRIGKQNSINGAYWCEPKDSCFTAFE